MINNRSAVTKELLVDLIKNFGKPDGKGGIQGMEHFVKKYQRTKQSIQSILVKLRRENFDIPKVRTSQESWLGLMEELKRDYAAKLKPPKQK